MKNIFFTILILFFGCGTILKNDPPPITDINNDGYDDDDIMFINKLIENSQTGNIPPDSDLNPLELGTQTWVEGRLRSIKHTGGSGEFFLYGDIPKEIQYVEYLNILVLEDNYLTSIPTEIKELTNLREIALNDNRFSGEVPEGLWLNKNLTNLSIHNNYFATLPESICYSYNDITNIILSHNNLCNVPECVTEPGIQSCNCYDYITLNVCLDSNISSCNKSIEQLLTNCPLKQFWGETVFANLDTLNSNYCVDWEGSCANSLIITNADIEFAIDLTEGCVDCNGNSCDGNLPLVGDGYCDESVNLNFACEEFNCDMQDCGFYTETESLSSCKCQRDCLGNCLDQAACGGDGGYWYAYGFECCVDDGTCVDLNSDGEITTWTDDEWCDDGTWGYAFNCEEYNCDGGACGVWDSEIGACVQGAGRSNSQNKDIVKPHPKDGRNNK